MGTFAFATSITCMNEHAEMKLAAALSRDCGNNSSTTSVLRKLNTGATLYETQQPTLTASDDDAAATAAWLQQQRLHMKPQNTDCSADSLLVRDEEPEERNKKFQGGNNQVSPQPQQPAQSEDVHLQRLLASEGLMRCETLNLFRAQLQQLSRRKDGLMPRADGSFPENWLLMAWEYQGLAEEVMSCQQWPGKYPEGLLRCVTQQVLYLKSRLEAFPSMTTAERDQFKRLYVLAALGIIAKLKLVTFCWTFVELKRGEEMAQQMSGVGRNPQPWQLQQAGNTVDYGGDARTTPPSSAVNRYVREALAASAALPSESIPSAERLSLRAKKKAASLQACPDTLPYAPDTSRRKKEEHPNLGEEQHHQEQGRLLQERQGVEFTYQRQKENAQQKGLQTSEGEQATMQEGTMTQQAQLPEKERKMVMKDTSLTCLSLSAGVAAGFEQDRSGRSEQKTVAASEEERKILQETSGTCMSSSRRTTEDLKLQQGVARSIEGKLDGAESAKKAEAKHLEGVTPEVQSDGHAEAPEKTEYTTRSGRKTHRVKADVS